MNPIFSETILFQLSYLFVRYMFLMLEIKIRHKSCCLHMYLTLYTNKNLETCLVQTELSIFLKGTFTDDGHIGTSMMKYLRIEARHNKAYSNDILRIGLRKQKIKYVPSQCIFPFPSQNRNHGLVRP